MDKLHYIHCRNGRIGEGTDTTPANIDAMVSAAQNDGRGHLVLHFHGGLVSKTAGLDIAQRLTGEYKNGGYPVFYVWESGFLETIRNNLGELAGEPVFKQLIRKLLQYALERLGGTDGARSILPGTVDPREVRKTVEEFWSQPSKDRIPYRKFDPLAPQSASRSASGTVDADEIQADLESDDEFAAALATLPDIPPGARSAMTKAIVVEHRSAFSEAVADRVSERAGSRGLIAWFKVAMLVKDILVNVLSRYGHGRDHGLYATVVEEIVREVKLTGSGINEWAKALQWNRMKQDALDAFGPGADVHAGTALLVRIHAASAGTAKLKRVTLVGHSTGAIYIAHWLAAADKLLPPDVSFDVVFLAPAITYDLFDKTLSAHGKRIANFRMYCMRDELERDDQVWGDDGDLQDGQDWRRFVYPSSLLYLVSGILESSVGADGQMKDAPDMPILGMERFYARPEIYGDAEFPAIARVRKWLVSSPNRAVWSKAEGLADGLNCGSADHGGFDNDKTTIASLVSVLKGW